jgi:hypothetical protein
MYSFGMRAPVVIRLLMMPLILVFTVMRILANATCRAPLWPDSIEKVSKIDTNDPYAEPRAGTPIGWGDTIEAQLRGEYPDNPKAKAKNWSGRLDSRQHAVSWLDDPTAHAAG